MTSLCEDLRSRPAAVVALWDAAIEAEPWILPRQHASAAFVPDIVAAIAELTLCAPPRRDAAMELARTAARHATARAESGADHARVVLEYYVLRNAMWTFFRQHERQPEDVHAILLVDVAISLATRAALLGYYRSDFEARGRWEGALEQLVEEAPPVWTAGWRPPGPRGA